MEEMFEYFKQFNLSFHQGNLYVIDLIMAMKNRDYKEYRDLVMCYPHLFFNLLATANLQNKEDYKPIFYMKILDFNKTFITSTPYSHTEMSFINPILSIRHLTDKQCREVIRTNKLDHKQQKMVLKEILGRNDKYLNSQNLELKRKILMQEKMRLFFQEEYQKIAKWLEKLSEENIANILESLKKQNLTDEVVLKDYEKLLNDLYQKQKSSIKIRPVKVKKDVVYQRPPSINKPIKLGYTNKEMKAMEQEIRDALKSKEPLSVDVYLDYMRKGYVLVSEGIITNEMLEAFYQRIKLDDTSYSFLYQKAKFMLNTNLGIDLYPLLEEIDTLNEMYSNSSESDKLEIINMLDENYVKIYNLLAHNYTYERKLN